MAEPTATAYELHRERTAARQATQSRSGRDIGSIPEVVDLERRKACRRDFGLFARTYFSNTFYLPFSSDHFKVIGQIQTAILHGGMFAMAMPRGSGKTSLCEAGALYATLYGLHAFVALIGADATSAEKMLANIKSELEHNDLLLEDFPEACYPIRKLERIAQRGGGQLCNGIPTCVSWGADEVVLPSIVGAACSSAIICTAGITGRIRGMSHTRPDGRKVRPSLAVIDDPQTDESAMSVSQCQTRERVISGAVLGLAGPGVKIAAIMPCTVIRADDLADRMLSRKLHPEWTGTRTKMVLQFPTDLKLWDQYAEVRAAGLEREDGGAAGNAFYEARREAMDAGAVVAWPERKNPDEISAIQHAMNHKIRDPLAFAAEYQNEPQVVKTHLEVMTAGEIMAKLHGLPQGTAPAQAQRVTAFIDVQERGLFWALIAWREGFTGAVVDYGVYPEQNQAYFTYRQMEPNLETMHPSHGVEARITAGLTAILGQLADRKIAVDGGSALMAEKIGVDIGDHGDVVEAVIASSPHRARLVPMRGYGVTASAIPMAEWAKRPGERRHPHWIEQASGPGKPLRRVIADVNWWKSFVHARLRTPLGGAGSLSLFGQSQHVHRCLADHLTAETPVETQGRGRTVHAWTKIASRDNHWLDCMVGSTVLASVLGVRLEGETKAEQAATRRRAASDNPQRRYEYEQRRQAGRR